MAKQTKNQSDQYSFDQFLTFVNQNFTLILLALLVFGGGFLSGSMWKENKVLKGKTLSAQDEQKADQPEAPRGPSEDQLKKMPKVSAKDHQRGAKRAKITFVEYSDYECPFCNKFHPTMKQIMDEYGKQVKWVYRHFPLDALHKNARKLSEMSECIAKYGSEDKFWQFSDQLYKTIADDTSIAEIDNALDLTAQIGVNRSQVKSCLDGGEMADKVDQQVEAAKKAGISGTPGTIMITKDGSYELIPGALPFDSLKQKIEANL
jgi:protein-disulfide isomerase